MGEPHGRNEDGRHHRLGRFAARARWCASTLLTLASFYVALPASLGGRVTYTVVSGRSMEPTYHTYDLAVTGRFREPGVGSVIVYRVPAGEPGAGKQVIHRIVGGDGQTGYVTQGDNRDTVDIWRPRRDDVIGSVVFVVPKGGRVLLAILNPANLGLVALAALAWACVPRGGRAARDPAVA